MTNHKAAPDADVLKTAASDAQNAAVTAVQLWYESVGRALYDWVLHQGDEFVARQPEISERLGSREVAALLELVRAGAISVRAAANTSAGVDVWRAIRSPDPVSSLVLTVKQLRDMAESDLCGGLREAGYVGASGQTWAWYGPDGEPGPGSSAAALNGTPEAEHLVDLVLRAKRTQEAIARAEIDRQEGDAATSPRRGRKHWAPTDRITLDLWEPSAIALMSWLEATDERTLNYDHPAQKQALRDVYFALLDLGYSPQELEAANRQVSRDMSLEDREPMSDNGHDAPFRRTTSTA